MSSSDERLQEIARRRRAEAESTRSRVIVVAVAGAVLVAAAAVAAWYALGGVPTADHAAGNLTSQAMELYLERRAADLEAPGADDTPVAFEIAEGETLVSVGDRLAAQGLVRDAEAFRMLARVEGLDTGIQAGSHVLRSTMSAREVLEELQVAAGDAVTVTILEGLRAEEVAEILAAAGLGDEETLSALMASDHGGDRPLLSDRPAGTGLEGYLFPDTYQFEPDAEPVAVVDRLLDTFEARVAPELPGRGAAADLSLFEVVTLASIVEREAVLQDERGMIARVFLNRLETPPYLLNADPTVQYALGFQPDADTWWKRPLYDVDLETESPYNTYQVPGLPPAPIASPGLASIRAVLDAPDGPWQYFVANDVACDGSHVFAETLDEHIANIAAYQTGECGP